MQVHWQGNDNTRKGVRDSQRSCVTLSLNVFDKEVLGDDAKIYTSKLFQLSEEETGVQVMG